MSNGKQATEARERNGAERGAENLARVQAAVARLLEAGPAERIAGQINKQWFAREAAIDTQSLKRSRNPRCAAAFEVYDAADKERWLTRIEARRIDDDNKQTARTRDSEKDDLILGLRAENAKLRAELEQFRTLRRLMTETGRMP